MKAMVHTGNGSTDLLQLQEVAKPALREDELLVKVVAAALNQADWHWLRSGSRLPRLGAGRRSPRVMIPGSDIAGWVEAVGRKVRRLQPGDAVFGDLSASGRGGLADYVAAPESALALKPAGVTFEQAAAVPMTAVTALQGLRDKGALQPGDRVLINGASGGVGTFAVQLARALGGVEVTAVCSTGKVELVRTIGADRVIDYTQEDITQNGRRYDLIFDTVANHPIAAYRRALNPGGRYVTCAFSLGALFLGPWIRLTEGKKMANMLAKPDQADLVFLAGLLDAGQVVPVIDRRFPLSAAAEALRYLDEGHARGKVIITLDPATARQSSA